MFFLSFKNPAHGRHRISRPMRIEAPQAEITKLNFKNIEKKNYLKVKEKEMKKYIKGSDQLRK